MGRFVVRRLLLLIPTLLSVYTITFLLIHATPGGPWDTGDKPISAEAIAALNKAYGLDKPMWRQYTDYLVKAVRGDFGPSYAQRSRDVTDIIKDFLPVSIKLGIAAMIIAALIGITAGTIGAVKQNTPLDYLATFGAIVGVSSPSYVVASLLILVLASYLHWLPTGGWDGIFSKQAIIPALALALGPAAALARYTRASLLEVLRHDYVRTARAKGQHERAVILRHALRNALIPVEKAKALLAEAGFPNGEGWPEDFTLVHRTTSPLPLITQYLQQEWKQNLGINVQLQPLEPRAYVEWRSARETQPYNAHMGIWGSDYSDPSNWHNQLYASNADFYHTHWKNDEFDSIVAKAMTMTDPEARAAEYAKAEEILVQEAANVPVYHGQRFFVTKPYVKDVYHFPTAAAGSWLRYIKIAK